MFRRSGNRFADKNMRHSRTLAQHGQSASSRDAGRFRTFLTLMRQLDAEAVEQPAFPGRGQAQRAAIALPREPAELQAAAPDLRAHQTGNVIAALAPIEAGPAEDSLAA